MPSSDRVYWCSTVFAGNHALLALATAIDDGSHCLTTFFALRPIVGI